MGRHSGYTEELGDSIAERLIERSLIQICQQDTDVPDRSTVTRWMVQHPEFASKCARAREEHAEYRMELAAAVADTCDEGNANSAKVKISFAQWYAAKVKPKKYGDLTKVQHEGADGGGIQFVVRHIKGNE